jgi:hypothetical protein
MGSGDLHQQRPEGRLSVWALRTDQRPHSERVFLGWMREDFMEWPAAGHGRGSWWSSFRRSRTSAHSHFVFPLRIPMAPRI